MGELCNYVDSYLKCSKVCVWISCSKQVWTKDVTEQTEFREMPTVKKREVFSLLSECCRDAVMYSLSALVLLHVYIRPADSYIKRFAFTNICPASDARLCVLHPWYLYLGYSFQSVTNKITETLTPGMKLCIHCQLHGLMLLTLAPTTSREPLPISSIDFAPSWGCLICGGIFRPNGTYFAINRGPNYLKAQQLEELLILNRPNRPGDDVKECTGATPLSFVEEQVVVDHINQVVCRDEIAMGIKYNQSKETDHHKEDRASKRRRKEDTQGNAPA